MDALRTTMNAVKRKVDFCISKAITHFGRWDNAAYIILLVGKLGSSIGLPAFISADNDNIKKHNHHASPVISYVWFVINAAISLLVLAWSAGLLSRPNSYKQMLENRVVVGLMKCYFFSESIALTNAIGTFSAQGLRTLGTVKVINLVGCCVGLVVYLLVLLVARNLSTGYEGTVLAVILTAAYTFASQLAAKTSIPVIVLVIGTVVGILLTILTHYCLREETLLKDADLDQILLQACRLVFARAQLEERDSVLVRARTSLAQRTALGNPVEPNVVVDEDAPRAHASLLTKAREILIAAAEAALLQVAPAAQASFIEEAIAALAVAG